MSTFFDSVDIKEFIKLNKTQLYKNGSITLSHGKAYKSLVTAMNDKCVAICTSNKTQVFIIKVQGYGIEPTFIIYLENSIEVL